MPKQAAFPYNDPMIFKKMMFSLTAVLLCILIAFGSLPTPTSSQNALLDPDLIIQTSTKPASIQKLKDFRQSLSDYPFFEKYCFSVFEDSTDCGTYVIPGLQYSSALNEQDQPSVCGNMIPQGICSTPDYLIVSCYCHDEIHHSVLQVINKKTGKFEKTVILEDYPHAGSIAYDPQSDLLWISTGQTKNASVSAISLNRIRKYDFTASQSALTYDKRYPIPSLVRNSFMTYYDNHIYAGTFSRTKNSTPLEQMYVEDSGVLAMKNTTPNTVLTNNIAPNCQGIAMNDQYIFASYSYGPYETSTLAVYKSGTDQLFPMNALKTWKLPETLEQIWIDGDKLYIMFESAGWPFRNDTIHHIDRIITVSIPALKLP